MDDVAVIDDRAAAESWLDPIRARLLARLVEPGSASSLAGQLGIPRQKINYHLRTLEKHGLVRLVEERRRGNMTERVLQATAGSYVISPDVAPELAPDPAKTADRLSARWLLALAARLVRDVGALLTHSAKANKKVATYALDGQIRFATQDDRAAFAADLSEAITRLAAKYHSDHGRTHRIVIAVHPEAPTLPPATDQHPAARPQDPAAGAAAIRRPSADAETDQQAAGSQRRSVAGGEAGQRPSADADEPQQRGQAGGAHAQRSAGRRRAGGEQQGEVG